MIENFQGNYTQNYESKNVGAISAFIKF